MFFEQFDTLLIDWAGREDHPHTVVAAGCKGALSAAAVEGYRAEMLLWKERSSGFKKPSLGARLLPPVLYRLDRKIVKRWRGTHPPEKR